MTQSNKTKTNLYTFSVMMRKFKVIDNALGWLMFVVAAVTYMLTLEPTASFWDCPEYVSQGFKLEVGHPPGNPIFILTARFIINFFGSDPTTAALAVNAMSGLLSAGTILLLFWSITHLVRRLIVKDGEEGNISLTQMLIIFGSGICGSLMYAWSDTFWFSAVEAEVYAFSSFCTALVFWLILKWEDHADEEHSDRYLILIAYMIGVSVAVHLLNLLCIPAIVLVYYYKRYTNTTAAGSLKALLVSFAIIVAILYGLVPGFVEMSQYFELFFVNTLGLGFNSGVIFYALFVVGIFTWCVFELYKQQSSTRIKWAFFCTVFFSGMLLIGDGILIPILLIAALAVYLWKFCKKIPVRWFTIAVMSIFVIFVGYSSYAVILIRSSAQTPIDQNSPDNVFSLASYLNREQYGDRPLLYGQTFNAGLMYKKVNDKEYLSPMKTDGKPLYAKKVKTSPDEKDSYIVYDREQKYTTNPELDMLFPRMYSGQHAQQYKEWAGVTGTPVYIHYLDENGQKIPYETKIKPTFFENIRFFFDYQMNYMYWRYFMWNFAGRQNDIQGNGEITQGNWISGIPFIDNLRLGDQSLMPAELTTDNKGHNVFYLLPLIFGIIGLLWQAFEGKRGIEQFWVVCFLFLMTGVAIVVYLNQTPGQPRERDYAYAGSFYAFAIWVGMGVAGLWQLILSAIKYYNKKADTAINSKNSFIASCVAVVAGLFIPLQVVSQTWDDHDRSGRYAARDFGMNYLDSIDPNGIIFTNGDNDTFPLWYAQEVENYRTDVRVVNLSYLSTDWYISQMKRAAYDSKPLPMLASNETFAYDKRSYGYFIEPDTELSVPVLKSLEQYYDDSTFKKNHRELPEIKYPNMYIPVNADEAIAQNVVPERLREYINPVIDANMLEEKYIKHEEAMNTSRVMSLDIIASSINEGWKRPTYFATTVPDRYYLGLKPYMMNTGMAYQITPVVSSGNGEAGVNTDKMYENVTKKFRWGGLDQAEPGSIYLDETVRRMVASLRSSMTDLASALIQEGYQAEMETALMDSTSTEFAEKEAFAKDRYTKAREVLDLMVTKIPEKTCSYIADDGQHVAQYYIHLGEITGNKEDFKKAKEILSRELLKYGEYVRFYQSLDYSMYRRLTYLDHHIDTQMMLDLLSLYNEATSEEETEAMMTTLESMGVNLDRLVSMRQAGQK